MNGTGRLPGGFHRSGARLGSKRTRTSPAACSPGLLARRTCGSRSRILSCGDVHVFRDGFFDFARRGCSLFPVTVFLAAPARLCPFGGRSTFFGAFFAVPARTAGRFEPDCWPVIPFPRALVFTEGPVPAPAGPSRLTLRLSPLPSARAIALTLELVSRAEGQKECLPSLTVQNRR